MFVEDVECVDAWRAEARGWARDAEPTAEELYEADVAEEYRREALAESTEVEG